jgi:alanine dehydrogenase
MIIGVPKEIKNNENRVALTPAGVTELRKHGHTVYVQAEAGKSSGFTDDQYIHRRSLRHRRNDHQGQRTH